MAVWGLQTYKKDGCQLDAEKHHKPRKYVSSRVYVWSAARISAPPHVQFVRSSNARLKAILKGYIQQVGADATRFINMLWKSISGRETVESFLGEHELSPLYGRIVRSFHRLEYFGDFLLAGRSLRDAFDTYSCLIYIRMILMGRNYFMEEASLIELVIKCGRSAKSDEQKELAFNVLEYCLLSQSITGLLTDKVSESLRHYYTNKNPSQKCHIEPHLGSCPGDIISKLYSGISPTFIVTHRSMSPSWVVTKRSDLYLPIQHAIYAHLWRKLHVDFPSLDSYDTDTLAPNLQLCEVLATSSHILAQDTLKKSSPYLLGGSEAFVGISVQDTLFLLFRNEVCSTDLVDKLYPTTASQKVWFLDGLRALYQENSYIHTQCMQGLQVQALAFIDSCASLSITRDLPLSVVLHRDKDRVKDSAAALANGAEVMDIEMTESSHSGAPQSSFVYEPPSATSQSVYLCSSSIQSSMHSMMSMASRIRRNAQDSTLLGHSQLSSNSMAMSISGSFDFSRVTGMDLATLPGHSMDIMEIDEYSTSEEDMDEGIFAC